MLRKVRIDQPGDATSCRPSSSTDSGSSSQQPGPGRGRRAATAQRYVGVTKASLNTFVVPCRGVLPGDDPVLTEAAVNGSKDHLIGLKENVIIGKLIPAGSGAPANVAARKAPRAPGRAGGARRRGPRGFSARPSTTRSWRTGVAATATPGYRRSRARGDDRRWRATATTRPRRATRSSWWSRAAARRPSATSY